MKLLFDENLPQRIRRELPGHDVFTTGFMKWAGVRNGELLRLAANAGFDAIITNDRGLEYEQNLGALPIAVIVVLVKNNTIEAIRPLYGQILAALGQLKPCSLVKIS